MGVIRRRLNEAQSIVALQFDAYPELLPQKSTAAAKNQAQNIWFVLLATTQSITPARRNAEFCPNFRLLYLLTPES